MGAGWVVGGERLRLFELEAVENRVDERKARVGDEMCASCLQAGCGQFFFVIRHDKPVICYEVGKLDYLFFVVTFLYRFIETTFYRLHNFEINF